MAPRAERPVHLRVLETVAAGGFATQPVAAGSAIRIMTGAPLPEAADTVVRVEDTDGGTKPCSCATRGMRAATCARAAKTFEEGDALLDVGAALGAAQIGILASVGRSSVDVYPPTARRHPRIRRRARRRRPVPRSARRPQDRLVERLHAASARARRRRRAGEPRRRGGRSGIVAGPSAARDGCDLVITSAGVSVGEFDYTRDVIQALGARDEVLAGADASGRAVGLRPARLHAVDRAAGKSCVGHGHVRAVRAARSSVACSDTRDCSVVRCLSSLEERVTIGARLTHFLRAIVSTRDDGTVTARLTGPQGSGILTSMSLANALLVVPEDRPVVEAGETLHALPLGDTAGLTTQFAL